MNHARADRYRRQPLDKSRERGKPMTHRIRCECAEALTGSYEFEWNARSSGTGRDGPDVRVHVSRAATGRGDRSTSREPSAASVNRQRLATWTSAAVDIKAPPPANSGSSGPSYSSPSYSYSDGYTPPSASGFDYDFPDSGSLHRGCPGLGAEDAGARRDHRRSRTPGTERRGRAALGDRAAAPRFGRRPARQARNCPRTPRPRSRRRRRSAGRAR